MTKLRPSNARLQYYMKIYRLAASPDELWLAASDNLSRICLFKLSDCLSSSASDESRRLSHFLQLSEPVFAMRTVDQLLVCGDASGRIFAYDWAELVKRSDVSPKTVFSFGVFDGLQSPVAVLHEANGLLYCSETERLYVGGAADNAIREYDVNVPNKPIHVFSGHSATICELASASPEQLLSASADGTVRVWDVRKNTEGHVICVADEPKKFNNMNRNYAALGQNEVCSLFIRFFLKEVSLKVSRPKFGKCVSALAVDNKFMVCGGGVDLGIWHVGMYSLATPMEAENG
ncbi:WD domain, G-beta repeat protein [Dictyocaulus viviparus]|uniref:WD domain, G-beta repeat protein n=1 Tax=Dictyocaulus viviparus TaxID=29172 RepID=A0A0D8Y1H7_DICVI|nr:WD domain, G-beta repeat protein [Dictyocaulus viviparus]